MIRKGGKDHIWFLVGLVILLMMGFLVVLRQNLSQTDHTSLHHQEDQIDEVQHVKTSPKTDSRPVREETTCPKPKKKKHEFKDLFPGNNRPLNIIKTIHPLPFYMVLDSKVHGTTDDTIANKYYYAPSESRIFEQVLLKRCKKLKDGKPPLVVDVGANVGYFTMLAASFGCRVLSFEPIPSAAFLIETSILVNGFQDLVTFQSAVASSKKGSVKFSVQQSWGYSSIDFKDSTDSVEVPSITLDSVVHEDVLLLKVDVEGYEDEVFNGAKQLLTKYKVENIVCETKGSRAQDEKRAFINERLDQGYQVWGYDENYVPKEYSPFSSIEFWKIPHLNPGAWFRGEDLWYTLNHQDLDKKKN